MEALQSGQSAGSLPPSALPSATSTAAPAAAANTLEVVSTAIPVTPSPEPIVSTQTPTATATIALEQASPTAEPTFVLPTPLPLTHEQRWRAQEINRIVFDPQRVYTTSSSELWWYDPINQQSVILGTFTGNFLAQAQFALRGQGIDALEVPYQVNKSYGLTALSPAIVARIAAAGGEEWIETYVFVTPNIVSR